MTAPILRTTGIVLMVGGGKVYVDGPEPVPGEEALAVPASADEERAYAALLMKEGAVRITIEPAEAPEVEPPHGSALDYLAELKGLLNKTLDAYAVAGETDSDLRRCLSLANSASLAILSAQRGTR